MNPSCRKKCWKPWNGFAKSCRITFPFWSDFLCRWKTICSNAAAFISNHQVLGFYAKNYLLQLQRILRAALVYLRALFTGKRDRSFYEARRSGSRAHRV